MAPKLSNRINESDGAYGTPQVPDAPMGPGSGINPARGVLRPNGALVPSAGGRTSTSTNSDWCGKPTANKG